MTGAYCLLPLGETSGLCGAGRELAGRGQVGQGQAKPSHLCAPRRPLMGLTAANWESKWEKLRCGGHKKGSGKTGLVSHSIKEVERESHQFQLAQLPEYRPYFPQKILSHQQFTYWQSGGDGSLVASGCDPCCVVDVNECLKLSCGPFAKCENTVGSYHCICLPGYRLLSGAKVFANESENTCRASVDTGMTSVPSGIHTVATAPGSLPEQPATMRPWTRLRSKGSGERTPKDLNECTTGQNNCHKSTHCMNKSGNYSCICRKGWKPVPGSPNGPTNTMCEDIDECSSGEHQCHNSTICINTQGFYKCHCRPGWEKIPESFRRPMDTKCQELPFPKWTLPPKAHSQSLFRFSVEVQSLLRDFNPATTNYTIKKLIEATDKLLEAPTDVEHLARHQVAAQLLSNLEQSLRTLAKFLPKGPFTYTSPSNTELSLMIKEQDNKDVTTVHSKQGWMMLDWAVTAGAKSSGTGYSVAGILSSPNIQKLLANASLSLDGRWDALEERFESPVLNVSLELRSNISSIFLTNTDTEKLASNVTLNFYSVIPEWEKSIKPRQELICAFWRAHDNGSGAWATDGCSMNGTGFCHCNHLTSFAILMAQYNVQDPTLAFITKVGLSISLVCLLLCILTFLLVKPIQSSRTMVHLHLCICLFLGSVIFLVGVENEGGEVSLRCRLVAVLLHYCFLAAFCWMALEGVELYFLVVRVFQGQGLNTWCRCLTGYGVPLLIVAISAAVKIEGYGHPTYCWLNYKKDGFLWSFVGPLAFIILCNAAIFVITVWKLMMKFSEINPNLKKLRKARVLTITATAQLFVLGCTWVFGLFLFNPHSQWLSYIFTLLNCLQGLYLYVMLCLLNKKVREEYRKWACLLAGNKYSEFSSSTMGTGTSQSQTRALRPSESGM
ncbi:adhesion G protein-coupled receptor E5 [Acomys russatus]|uniref:adhesion G protein-coupled receptor E5 n=1 Tax=Acomys russatus TaxID=60746 RepID=UPI0021E2DA0D|nr:adhesion G protein-coupled receptor E5 [Acomys russatus]